MVRETSLQLLNIASSQNKPCWKVLGLTSLLRKIGFPSLKCRTLPDPPRGAVVLFDRGVVDNVAYCTEVRGMKRHLPTISVNPKNTLEDVARIQESERWRSHSSGFQRSKLEQEAWSMVQEECLGLEYISSKRLTKKQGLKKCHNSLRCSKVPRCCHFVYSLYHCLYMFI